MTSLDSSGSVSHEQDNPHAHGNCNYDRGVRERGELSIHKMWRVCVLLSFIKPILGNRYVWVALFYKPDIGELLRSRGFLVSADLDNLRCVCCFVLLTRYWGIVTVPGCPCVNRPQIITWGCRILTLHLNYVTDYTGPLLFLSERTHNYYVDNQGLVLWRLRRRVTLQNGNTFFFFF